MSVLYHDRTRNGPCMAAHKYALDVDGIDHEDCIVFVTFY